MRVNERQFLRHWAGTSMMPALLVWGMRHGAFSDDSAPMELSEVAEATGYTVAEVYQMAGLVDRLYVKETENESTHNTGIARR